MQFFDKTMVKFLLVGIVNTIVGCGTMFFLYNVLGFSYWLASASNYTVGGIVSFLLNKYFTFQNKTKSIQQVLRFLVTVSICYFVGYGAAKPLAQIVFWKLPFHVQENIAMGTGMVIYTGLNYLGQRYFTFKKEM